MRHVEVRLEKDGCGQGSFGIVRAASIPEQNNRQVVVKHTKDLDPDRTLGLPPSFIREVNVMFNLRHTHLLHGVYFSCSHSACDIVMPRFTSDLQTLCRTSKRSGRRVADGSSAVDLAPFTQLTIGLAALHDSGYTHRDIKPANIVYDRSRDRYSLCDFGSAVPFRPEDRILQERPELSAIHAGIGMGACTRAVATMWYAAPEVLLGTIFNHTQSDVWSLGLSLVEHVLEGKIIIHGAHPQEVFLRQIVVVSPDPTDVRELCSIYGATALLPLTEAICVRASTTISSTFKSALEPRAYAEGGLFHCTLAAFKLHVSAVDALIDSAHASAQLVRTFVTARHYFLPLRMIECQLFAEDVWNVRDGLLIKLACKVGLLVARVIVRMMHILPRKRITARQACRVMCMATYIHAVRDILAGGVPCMDASAKLTLACRCDTETEAFVYGRELMTAPCSCCGTVLVPASFDTGLGGIHLQPAREPRGCILTCLIQARNTSSSWPDTIHVKKYEYAEQRLDVAPNTARGEVHSYMYTCLHLLHHIGSGFDIDVFFSLVHRSRSQSDPLRIHACMSLTLKVTMGLFRAERHLRASMGCLGLTGNQVASAEAAVLRAVAGKVVDMNRHRLPTAPDLRKSMIPQDSYGFCARVLCELACYSIRDYGQMRLTMQACVHTAAVLSTYHLETLADDYHRALIVSHMQSDHLCAVALDVIASAGRLLSTLGFSLTHFGSRHPLINILFQLALQPSN
jgi:serine/threonine protein kinase